MLVHAWVVGELVLGGLSPVAERLLRLCPEADSSSLEQELETPDKLGLMALQGDEFIMTWSESLGLTQPLFGGPVGTAMAAPWTLERAGEAQTDCAAT